MIKLLFLLLPFCVVTFPAFAEEVTSISTEVSLGEEMLRSETRIPKRLETQKWAVEMDSQTRIRKIADGRIMRLEILRTGRVAWRPQLIAGNLKFEKEKTYVFSIRIRADRPGRLSLGVRRSREPWDNLGFQARIDVGTEWKTFRFAFRLSETTDKARLDLTGFKSVVYEISDSSLRPVCPGPQIPALE